MERTTHDALKTIVKKLPAGQFSGRGHVEDKGLDTKINDNPFSSDRQTGSVSDISCSNLEV
jgi:hypothetical protein